jgi:hypothetical protein
MRGMHNKCRLFGVKLGTAMDVEDAAVSVFPRVEAVSFGGECRELLSWMGEGADAGVFAVHVESGQVLPQSRTAPFAESPGAYLFHADPAAIKAHCLGTLCAQYGLSALGDSDGYLTADEPVGSPWLRPYRVLYHGRADRKATQAEVTRLDGTLTEVKTRGTREPADAIRSQFKAVGDRKLTLAVWPIGKSLRHTLVEPALPP